MKVIISVIIIGLGALLLYLGIEKKSQYEYDLNLTSDYFYDARVADKKLYYLDPKSISINQPGSSTYEFRYKGIKLADVKIIDNEKDLQGRLYACDSIILELNENSTVGEVQTFYFEEPSLIEKSTSLLYCVDSNEIISLY